MGGARDRALRTRGIAGDRHPGPARAHPAPAGSPGAMHLLGSLDAPGRRASRDPERDVTAADDLARVAEARPRVLGLARVVSLAAHIDVALVRALRIALLADVS